MQEDYIRYDYFGITDAECAKDHTADDNKFLNYPEAFSSGQIITEETVCMLKAVMMSFR